MEERLIELVRRRPVLYDRSNREYRNQDARKEAWDEIGEKLRISGNDCKDLWNKLRNAYTQALKRRSIKVCQPGKYIGKWKFEDQLSFLELDSRTSAENLEQNNIDVEHTEDLPDRNTAFPVDDAGNSTRRFLLIPKIENDLCSVDCTQETVINQPSLPATSQPSAAQCVSHHNKKRLVETSIDEMASITKDNSHLRSPFFFQNPPTGTQNCAHDDCEMLFLSLAKTVKKLSPEEQVKLKMEVTQAVFQAELRAIGTSTVTAEQQSRTLSHC